MPQIQGYDVSRVPEPGQEREVVISQARGFHIRHPPQPHMLHDEITKDEDLFQTIHMGAVDVNVDQWLLVVDGLVECPFALTFEQLRGLPSVTIQSTHECFGSPLAPATTALWRVGNVTWTGVPLRTLLDMARPLPAADFVWSEGLDSGAFAGVEADCYQKDLPLSKAYQEEVLIAYKMNEEALGRERGGPVRLVVPGWFGTNSTKWICKISLRKGRAPGPYTTRLYNAEDQDDPQRRLMPVWEIDVNSMIVSPTPNTILHDAVVEVEGWAWSHDGVTKVEVSSSGLDWQEAALEPRLDFRWQKFTSRLALQPGEHTIIARATSLSGKTQATNGRRNHMHLVQVQVED